jgi:hypothetical protein
MIRMQAFMAKASVREGFQYIAVASGGASGSGRVAEQTALADTVGRAFAITRLHRN